MNAFVVARITSKDIANTTTRGHKQCRLKERGGRSLWQSQCRCQT